MNHGHYISSRCKVDTYIFIWIFNPGYCVRNQEFSKHLNKVSPQYYVDGVSPGVFILLYVGNSQAAS